MDSRYLLIIIIIVFSSLSLFFITENSDVIGSASVNFGNYTCSIPNNFNLMDTFENRVLLKGPNNLNVAIHISNSSKENYNASLNSISANNDYKIYSNGSISVGDIPVDSIFYYKKDSGDTSNRSVFYFEKYGSDFKVEMNSFNYNQDKDKIIDLVSYFVESLKINPMK